MYYASNTEQEKEEVAGRGEETESKSLPGIGRKGPRRGKGRGRMW